MCPKEEGGSECYENMQRSTTDGQIALRMQDYATCTGTEEAT